MELKLGRPFKSMHVHPMKMPTYVDFKKLPPLWKEATWDKAVIAAVGGPNGWGMDGNDVYGDCTTAETAHGVMAVTANAGKIVTPTVAEVLKMYQASGWVPGNANSDQGWTLDAANAYMVSTGLAGVLADGYLDIPMNSKSALYYLYAIQLFGGVNFGVNLPQSAMTAFQNANGGVCEWTDTTDTNILGGHSILGTGFYSGGSVRIVTWGSSNVIASPKWIATYADEACAVWYKAFIEASGETPSGLNLVGMEADARQLAA
jgi:hypothetical protein